VVCIEFKYVFDFRYCRIFSSKTKGKSYSIIGYGANRGIVPQLCQQIFEKINLKKEDNPGIEFEVK
jgi:kinesin family protein 1